MRKETGVKAQFCHLQTVNRLDIVISDVKAKAVTIYIKNLNTNNTARNAKEIHEYVKPSFLEMFPFSGASIRGFIRRSFSLLCPFFSVTYRR